MRTLTNVQSSGKQQEKPEIPPKSTQKQPQNAPKKKQEPKMKPANSSQQPNEEEEVKNILKEENLDELDDEKVHSNVFSSYFLGQIS